MTPRTVAIGDIHGCLRALVTLLDAIDPAPEDTLIFLGDYIDRGAESRGVLDRLIALQTECRVIPLLGNHEEMLLCALQDREALRKWLSCGGADTLLSYGWVAGGPRRSLLEWIPEKHVRFVMGCYPHHETDSHLFVHAGYLPELSLDAQPAAALRWRVTSRESACPHSSGKVAVVGHTPQVSGRVLDLGFLICIDTNCARGGWLTALEVETGLILQATENGEARSHTLRE